MKIKNKLSLYFSLTSTLVLLIVEVVLYFSFNSFVRSEFYDRLMDRAGVAAQVYLQADQISADSLSKVRNRYLKRLPDEVVRFYDDNNAPSFIKDNNRYWTNDVINAVRKHRQLQFAEGERQTVGIYYNDNQGNFVILVSADDYAGHKRLNDLVVSLGMLLLFVMACLFIISRWFAKKSLEPVGNIITQMQNVSAGNLSLRVDEGNGKDELSALAANFNRLLEHLENAFELQQTFVINASHELRTPITSIIGEIEIAMHKQRTNSEYEQVMQSVLHDAVRLKETVTSLLDLAHADMNYTHPDFKPVAMDELVWELSDYWNHKMGKGLFVVNILHLPDDHDNLLIAANKQLLTIAFNNIISNAFKFSENKRVDCNLYADDKSISIIIADQGVGIPTDEIEKIFGSFYRATNANEFMGNGVGLYVTNKIITLFGGIIRVNSVPGQGTGIVILFNK